MMRFTVVFLSFSIIGCSSLSLSTSDVYANYVNDILAYKKSGGDISVLLKNRDPWGRELDVERYDTYTIYRSLGKDPENMDDDIIIEHGCNHVSVSYRFDGEFYDNDTWY